MADRSSKKGGVMLVAATAGGRKAQRRRPSVTVKRSFPWGLVTVSALVALALVGILFYAVTKQGSGFVTALKRADARVPNLAVHKVAKSDHVTTSVTYPQTPRLADRTTALRRRVRSTQSR